MKKLILTFFLASFAVFSFAVDERTKVVEVTATAQSSPAKITVKWNDFGDYSTGNFVISRKLKTATNWTTLATVPTLNDNIYVITPMSYDDLTVVEGEVYDYRIVFTGTTYYSGTTISLYGYTSSGIEVPVVEDRGGIILLVDNTFQTTLATEITRLQEDLEGDGWNVITKYVSRTATVASVKTVIVNECNATPGIKSLFILGHVPVPYSGNQNPDGHGDHKGAWPADVFYGDLDGTWTDVSVNNTASSIDGTRNDNIPGDLKYDQIKLPSDVELQVGRVDMYNLPVFTSKTELQLLQKYLQKDHDYRKKVFVATERALVFDGFGGYASAGTAGTLGSNAWRNFPSLVGTSNVTNIDDGTQFHPMMTAGSYKWSYGCSAGSFSSIGQLQEWDATVTFATNEDQGIFMLLFGSYFGDWDSQDCILRQPLASGTTLTCAWAGSPLWYFQHMGMGEPIGYSIRLSQNNVNATYFSPSGALGDNARGIFMALMGDPTLRNDIVKPVSNVTASFSSFSCTLNWTASSQSNLGYNIYVKAPGASSYVKANTTPVVGTSYVHSGNTVLGTYKYMVRTLILQTSNTGTYYNMSEGIIKTVELTSVVPDNTAPTVPTGLVASDVTTTTLTLNWTASTDAVGVTAYDVYQGVSLIGSPTTNSFAVTGLTASTAYSFTVKAKDAANNISAASAPLAVTTAADIVVPPGAGIATWDLIGVNTAGGVQTAPVTTKDANLAVSNLTVGAGMGAPNDYFKDYLGGGNMSNAITLVSAISGNNYLEFTITPAAGKTVSITSIDVCAMTQGRIGTVSLLSSVAGFAAANLISSIATGLTNEANISSQNLPVTGHVNLTSATTFRLYFNSTLDWGFDFMAVGIGNRHTGEATADLIVNGLVGVNTGWSGIKEIDFVLYPNPATDKLTLDFGTEVSNAQITILDLQGCNLKALNLTNIQTHTLDISSLKSGVYFLKVINGNKVSNNKFVKK